MLILILIAAALIVVLVQLQRRYRIVQYAFLLRVPLLHALVLLALPLAYVTRAFKTLFVLDAPSIVIAVPLVLFSAMTAVYTAHLLFVAAPVRFSLRWDQPPSPTRRHWDDAPRPNVPLVGQFARTYVWPLVLAAPTLGIVLYASHPHDTAKNVSAAQVTALNVGAALAGVLIAWTVRAIAVAAGRRLYAWILSPMRSVPTTQVIKLRHRIAARLYRWMGGPIGRAVSPPDPRVRSSDDVVAAAAGDGEPGPVVSGAVGYAGLALLVYVAGAWMLSPLRTDPLVSHTPALAYLALVTIVFGLLLPAVSFYTDFYRVPLLVALSVYLAVSYAFVKREHFYHLTTLSTADPTTPPPIAADVIRDRLRDSTDQTMVVVAVSGGGSQATLWTSELLTQFANDSDLHDRFLPSIGMMSLVSGGALGAAYVVDRLQSGNLPPCPEKPKLCDAVVAAQRSHVGALSWGIVYPDTARLVFPSLFKDRDRGWALEQSWSRGFASSTRPTLESWASDARHGRRPIIIFNATAMETGERMLLSRIRLPGARARQFVDLYPGMDLPIVSAVRLSASFPYLAPRVRPANPRGDSGSDDAFEKTAFHLADGGYYDNFGVVTAAEFIEHIVSQQPPLAKRILLLQLKSALEPSTVAKDDDSWVASVLGPPAAQLSAARTGQLDRAAAAVDAAIVRAHQACVDLRSFTFWLKDTGTLPWHLSPDEQSGILKAADAAMASPEFKNMKAFFIDKDAGGTQLPESCAPVSPSGVAAGVAQ
ncbi:MAG: hypothetical protein QM736_05295 [Vicinamibacterales bacterium]